ncbi:unnamed protein product [Urochloa humidicola]
MMSPSPAKAAAKEESTCLPTCHPDPTTAHQLCVTGPLEASSYLEGHAAGKVAFPGTAEPTSQQLSMVEPIVEAAASEVYLPSELVAVDALVPARDGQRLVSPGMDPMRFEFTAPTPRMSRPERDKVPSPKQLQLKTYSRRPRSVATRPRAGAALPSPVRLDFEPSILPEPIEEPMIGASPRPVRKRAGPRAGEGCGAIPDPCTETGPSTMERARIDSELEKAKSATAALLASVSRALQAPLADLPSRRGTADSSDTSTTPAPRRSERLANQPLNSSVRASKKGEVLVMRKLGLCQAEGATILGLKPELKAIFTGPLDKTHFAAIRDIFPAANALSDADLMALATQATADSSIC